MITGTMSLSELRTTARERLKGNWGISVLTVVIYAILSLLINSGSKFATIGWIFSIMAFVLNGAWSAGFLTYFLQLVRQKPLSVKLLFSQLDRLFHFFILILLQTIFILLWALPAIALGAILGLYPDQNLYLYLPLIFILLIPAMIASLRYSLTLYLFIDYPEMKAMAALKKSSELMYGNKWRYVLLCLSFIGWFILSICTCAVGFLWSMPYLCTTQACFYEELHSKSIHTASDEFRPIT